VTSEHARDHGDPGPGGPLHKPPDDAEVLRYRDSLGTVRQFTADRARRAGLPPPKVNDLVIAVSELAANTLTHTSGPGTLTLWVTSNEVCDRVEIRTGQAGTTVQVQMRRRPRSN
jgi:hypothetical protein